MDNYSAYIYTSYYRYIDIDIVLNTEYCVSLRSHPRTPGRYPGALYQQFLKEFLSLWGFGEVWGTMTMTISAFLS